MSEFITVDTPNGPVRFPKGMSRADMAAALNSLPQAKPAVQPNPDGTYGQPPEGFVQNTMSGQMEDIRSPNNPNIPQGRAVAAGVGAGQGLGFGSFDEAVAGLNSLGGGDYDYELARTREMDSRAREQHPGYYYGAMIPGAVATSMAGGGALGVKATGANLAQTSARGAAIGGVEGGIYGFNTGEGGVENRLGSAARDAALGTLGGAAAPGIVAAGRGGFNVGRDLIGGGVDAAIGRANQGRANRVLTDTLRKSGRTLDDVAGDVATAAREGQPEFRMMDAMGQAGQRRTSGIVRAGGDGAEEIAQYLNQRQLDQTDRVTGFVDDAFGSRGTTAAQTRDSLTAARGAAADTAYDAARQSAGAVDVTPVMDDINGLLRSNVSVDGGVTGLQDTAIGRRLSNIGKQLSSGDYQAINFDDVLETKQEMYRAMQVMQRGGGVPPAFSKVYNQLDTVLEQASDGYRAANDGFREASRTIEAVDTGAQMARSGRAGDNVPAFQSMTPDQQGAARVGYANSTIESIEKNRATTANSAREFNSTKRTAEADAMALDPQLFQSRIGRENTMWETQNRALGGSRTADNLQDIGELGPKAEIARALMDIGNLQFGAAAGKIGNAVAPAVTGMNEPTRNLIAKALMSSDPRAALASAMRQESLSQGQRRVFEALTRAIGREVTP